MVGNNLTYYRFNSNYLFMQSVMKISITVTFSKIVALLVLGCATYLDIKTGTGSTTFMFALPFVVFLITGKQFIDKTKK